MAVTRSELRELLELANKAFPEDGAGKRFLKQSWNGVVAARICQQVVDTVCPVDFIRNEPEGLQKTMNYLRERISEMDHPSTRPDLV